MNSSANTSDHQGDPNWPTGNWDQSGAIGSLDQAAHQYTANRLDWEWDPMILAQHPGSGGSNDYSDADCKNHLAAGGTMSNLRTYNMLSGLPPNFTQTNMGMYNSAGIRNYGGLEALGNLHPSTSTIQNVLGSSGIPGLAPTGRAGLHSDLQSSFDDQRHREFYGGMQQNPYMVKREDENQHYTGVSMNGGRTQQNVCHYPELLVVVFMYSQLLISGQNQSHMSLFMSIHLVLADESGLLKQSPTRTTFCLLCNTHWCNLCR
jgi:hypothetical protein